MVGRVGGGDGTGCRHPLPGLRVGLGQGRDDPEIRVHFFFKFIWARGRAPYSLGGGSAEPTNPLTLHFPWGVGHCLSVGTPNLGPGPIMSSPPKFQWDKIILFIGDPTIDVAPVLVICGSCLWICGSCRAKKNLPR